MKKLALLAIDFYRNHISIYMLPSCRFYPTCSSYARQAIVERGLLAGCLLSFKRILRCHPFSKGGCDPVK